MDERPSLEEMQSLPLEEKLLHALTVIDTFYHKMEGKVYLGFSGGKDSCVLKWLCDKFTDAAGYPRVQLVFNNTTNEYQEILEFVKSFGDQVTWLRPKMTFAQSLQKNGYPLVSKEQAQRISEARNTKSDKLRDIRINGTVRKSKKTGREYVSGKISEKWKYLVFEDVEVTSKCCDILKKAPVRKFEKETGLHPIIGVMADESVLRRQQYRKTGCNTFDGKRPISKPLSVFTQEDIWTLIDMYDIEICSIYFDQEIDGEIIPGEERTGCAYCAYGTHFEDPENTKFHRLHKREPKRYKSMMDKLGYRKALHAYGIKLPDDEQN